MILPLLLQILASANPASGWESLFKVVRGSVFEVVVSKPPDTGVTYAGELPWENIPIRQRKDSVWSIGTAFAIGRDTVVTAAHVLWNADRRTEAEPRIRTPDGRIHPIGRMLKFSNQHDVAVFTVPGLRVLRPLKAAPPPKLGQVVHAVGNALGEGIVLRDGLFTSRTPEEASGEWDWVRFSAAASPGNSGGPLLDAQGGVLGVVLAKSQAENLNVALPWSEAQRFPSGKFRLRLAEPVSSYFYQGYLWREPTDTVLAIPSSWTEFRQAIDSMVLARIVRQRRMLINAEGEFPSRLHTLLTARPAQTPIPLPIYRDDRDRWQQVWLQPTIEDLVGGGRWSWAAWGTVTFAHFRLPDTIPYGDLLADGRKLSEWILRGHRLEREMGNATIRVKSLGRPVADSLHTDRWGRIWEWRSWRLPWNGTGLAALLLPQPCGFIVVVFPTDQPDFRGVDGLLLAQTVDHTVGTWHGTAPQWARFLADDRHVPKVLRSLSIDTLRSLVSWRGNTLTLPLDYRSSKPMSLSVSPGFTPGADRKGHIEIGSVEISPFRNSPAQFGLHRFGPPGDFEGDEIKGSWQNLSTGSPPFNGVPSAGDNGVEGWLTMPPPNFPEAKRRWVLKVILPPGTEPAEFRKALQRARLMATTSHPDDNP